MSWTTGLTRREFQRALLASGFTAAVPRWARGASPPSPFEAARVRGGAAGPVDREIAVDAGTVALAGERGPGLTLDGTIPGPLIELYEGHEARLRVTNHLDVDTSIHWHGILLPFHMDGVPGVSFPGIAPGETFEARFPVRQSGTYWYHSHSGLQEQSGIYGPLVAHPRTRDPHACDRDYVIVLSDWTFEDPVRILANLKKRGDYYQTAQPTLVSLAQRANEEGWLAALGDRFAWGAMRMNPADIADVGGALYTYLLNGRDASQNWTGLFAPGERVRLRLINASAMSYFNVRLPGLPMTVVAADGPAVEPREVDELQIAVAETYDVIVSPGDRAYTLFAEAMDRSGFVRGTLAPRPGMAADVPSLREPPRRTMADMGMAHGGSHGGGGSGEGGHDAHGHAGGAHAAHGHAGSELVRHGPDRHSAGAAGVADVQRSRLHEPGAGLEDVAHRVLTYADLRAATPRAHADRAPDRTLELHLTGNMERYMWSFDGVKFSEVDGPIEFDYGERVRLILVNDTMMEHPIHLHGMFVEVDNGAGARRPHKHTLSVKPAERVHLLLDANEPGPWAFHCHLLYHMKMGMMRVVRVNGGPDASA